MYFNSSSFRRYNSDSDSELMQAFLLDFYAERNLIDTTTKPFIVFVLMVVLHFKVHNVLFLSCVRLFVTEHSFVFIQHVIKVRRDHIYKRCWLVSLLSEDLAFWHFSPLQDLVGSSLASKVCMVF